MSGAPWDKDQIGSYTLAAVTGYQAHQNGYGIIDSVDIGLRWRFWYKATGFGVVLLILGLISMPFMVKVPTYSEQFINEYGVPQTHWYSRYDWLPLAYVEAPLLMLWWFLIMGTTGCKLVAFSGFKMRFFWRLFRPIARRIPNVANFWLYLLYALPVWIHFTLYSHQGLL